MAIFALAAGRSVMLSCPWPLVLLMVCCCSRRKSLFHAVKHQDHGQRQMFSSCCSLKWDWEGIFIWPALANVWDVRGMDGTLWEMFPPLKFSPVGRGLQECCSLNTTKSILTNRSESQEILGIAIIDVWLINAVFSLRSSCCFLWLMSCLINKTFSFAFRFWHWIIMQHLIC